MKNILRKSLVLSLSAVAIFALAPTNLMAKKPDSPPGKPAVTPPESPPGNPGDPGNSGNTPPGQVQGTYIKSETRIDLGADGSIEGVYAIYGYDADNNLLTKNIDRDADGNIDSYQTSTYDENGNRLTWSYTYTGGIGVWASTYDTNGNVVTKRLDMNDNNVVYDTFTYDTSGNQLTRAIYGNEVNYDNGSINIMTTYIYDEENGLRTTSEWDYDNNGTIEMIDTYTYDKKGNLILVSFDGSIDLSGNITPHDGIADRTIAYTYDGRGNMLSVTDSAGYNRIYTYDGNNNRLTEHFDNTGASGGSEYILYNTWIESD